MEPHTINKLNIQPYLGFKITCHHMPSHEHEAETNDSITPTTPQLWETHTGIYSTAATRQV